MSEWRYLISSTSSVRWGGSVGTAVPGLQYSSKHLCLFYIVCNKEKNGQQHSEAWPHGGVRRRDTARMELFWNVRRNAREDEKKFSQRKVIHHREPMLTDLRLWTTDHRSTWWQKGLRSAPLTPPANVCMVAGASLGCWLRAPGLLNGGNPPMGKYVNQCVEPKIPSKTRTYIHIHTHVRTLEHAVCSVSMYILCRLC